jgi:hypothetical protein
MTTVQLHLSVSQERKVSRHLLTLDHIAWKKWRKVHQRELTSQISCGILCSARRNVWPWRGETEVYRRKMAPCRDEFPHGVAICLYLAPISIHCDARYTRLAPTHLEVEAKEAGVVPNGPTMSHDGAISRRWSAERGHRAEERWRCKDRSRHPILRMHQHKLRSRHCKLRMAGCGLSSHQPELACGCFEQGRNVSSR